VASAHLQRTCATRRLLFSSFVSSNGAWPDLQRSPPLSVDLRGSHTAVSSLASGCARIEFISLLYVRAAEGTHVSPSSPTLSHHQWRSIGTGRVLRAVAIRNVCNPWAKRLRSEAAKLRRSEFRAWRRKGPGGPTGLQNRPGGHCVRRRVRLPPPSAAKI
jgi:hypothetical protein